MYFEPSFLILLVPIYLLARKYPLFAFFLHVIIAVFFGWLIWMLLPPALALPVFAIIAGGVAIMLRIKPRG